MEQVPRNVYGVVNFQRLKKMRQKPLLHDAVIQLHDVARLIEDQIGPGLLSEDIRSAADRLQNLLTIPPADSQN
jgi:hypothetical protein